MNEQDRERWDRLAAEVQRLRGVERENVQLKAKVASLESALRGNTTAPTPGFDANGSPVL